MKLVRLLTFVFFLTTASAMAISYTQYGEPWLHTQPNGTTTFDAVQWGSAFAPEYETDDGYTIVRSSSDGYWYYAELSSNGDYAPTSYKVGIDTAPSGALHLRRSNARREELLEIDADFRERGDDQAQDWIEWWVDQPAVPRLYSIRPKNTLVAKYLEGV